MAKQHLIGIVAAATFIAAGIVLFMLPHNWMELWLGNAPDGGTGLLESTLAPAAIAIGLGLLLLVTWLRRGARGAVKAGADPALQRDTGGGAKHTG